MSRTSARRGGKKAALRQEAIVSLELVGGAEVDENGACTITDTPAWLREALLAAVPIETTTVRYPVGVGADGRHLGEITETVRPWRPRVADPDPAVGDRWRRPEEWTADLVRAWVAAAVATLEQLPARRPGGLHCSLPTPIHSAAEAYGYGEIEVRVEPTGSDLARLDIVLSWIYALPLAQRQAVTGIAAGWSLRDLGRRLRCSHTQVSRLARQGIATLTATLNAA